MKIKINRKFCSKNPHFPVINQGNEKETKMMCTFYAPFITADWNSFISSKLQTEEKIEDILKNIAKKQEEKGLFDYNKGGYGIHGVEAISNYFNLNYISFDKRNKKDIEWIRKLLDNGQALTLGIKVGEEFIEDIKDGQLDGRWQEYKKNIKYGHFTTIVGSNQNVVDFGAKYSFVDSYAYSKHKEWTYKFNDLDGLLNSISMNTLYFIW